MKFTATTFPLAIDYKLRNRLYGASPDAVKNLPEGAATLDPFDTHTVMRNETWDLPDDATWHRERELSGSAT